MKRQRAVEFFSGKALELGQAIEIGNAAAVPALSMEVDLNQLHREDMTFLFFAMMHDNPEIVGILVRHGADPKQVVPGLGSPLDAAVRADDIKFLAAMLDAGVNPNVSDSTGSPILFTATGRDDAKAIELLQKRGANLDETDSLGGTAIYAALSKQRYDNVQVLLRAGASVRFATVNGVTMANALQRQLERSVAGTPREVKLRELKTMLERRGVTFPADPPPVVREKMKLQGLKVVD